MAQPWFLQQLRSSADGDLPALSSTSAAASPQFKWSYTALLSRVAALSGAMNAACQTSFVSPSPSCDGSVAQSRNRFTDKHVIVCGSVVLQSLAALACCSSSVAVFVPAEETQDETVSNVLVIQRACEAQTVVIDTDLWDALTPSLTYRLSTVPDCTVLVTSTATGQIWKVQQPQTSRKKSIAHLVPAPAAEQSTPAAATHSLPQPSDPLFIFHQRGKHATVTLSHEATDAYMWHGIRNLVQSVDPHFTPPLPTCSIDAATAAEPNARIRSISCAQLPTTACAEESTDSHIAQMAGSPVGTGSAVDAEQNPMCPSVAKGGSPSHRCSYTGSGDRVTHIVMDSTRGESTLTPRSKSLAPAGMSTAPSSAAAGIPACACPACVAPVDDNTPTDPGAIKSPVCCGSIQNGSFLSANGSFPHAEQQDSAPALIRSDSHMTPAGSSSLPAPPASPTAAATEDVIQTQQHSGPLPLPSVMRVAASSVSSKAAPGAAVFFDCGAGCGDDGDPAATDGMGRAVSSAIPAEMYEGGPTPWSEGDALRTPAPSDPCMEPCTVRRAPLCDERAVRFTDRVTDSVLLPVPSMQAFEQHFPDTTSDAGLEASCMDTLCAKTFNPRASPQTPLQQLGQAQSVSGAARLAAASSSMLSPEFSTPEATPLKPCSDSLCMFTPQVRGRNSLASMSPAVLQLEEASLNHLSCATTPSPQPGGRAPCLSPEQIVLKETSLPEVRSFEVVSPGSPTLVFRDPDTARLHVTAPPSATRESAAPGWEACPWVHKSGSETAMLGPNALIAVAEEPSSQASNRLSDAGSPRISMQRAVEQIDGEEGPLLFPHEEQVVQVAMCSMLPAHPMHVASQPVTEAALKISTLSEWPMVARMGGSNDDEADVLRRKHHNDDVVDDDYPGAWAAAEHCQLQPLASRAKRTHFSYASESLKEMGRWRSAAETEDDDEEDDRRGPTVAVEINFAEEDTQRSPSAVGSQKSRENSADGVGVDGVSLPWRSGAWSWSQSCSSLSVSAAVQGALGPTSVATAEEAAAEEAGDMIDSWPSGETAGSRDTRRVGVEGRTTPQPKLLCALPPNTPAGLLFGMLLPWALGWHVALCPAPVQASDGEALWAALCGSAGSSAPDKDGNTSVNTSATGDAAGASGMTFDAVYMATAACDVLTRRALQEHPPGERSEGSGVGGAATFSAALSTLAVCAMFGPSLTPATAQSFVASMLPFGLRRTAISFVCSTWELPVVCPPLLGLHTLETGIRCAAGDCTSALGHVAVVATTSRCALPDGAIGNVWVHSGGASQTVTRGMAAVPLQWIFDPSTRERKGPYKVTGLAGYMDNGRLFVIGRYADMLFAPDAAHHASDIEAALLGGTPSFAIRSFALRVPPSSQAQHGAGGLAFTAGMPPMQAVQPFRMADLGGKAGGAKQGRGGGAMGERAVRNWLKLSRNNSPDSVSGVQVARRNWGWWGLGGTKGCVEVLGKGKGEKGTDGAVLVVRRQQRAVSMLGKAEQLWQCVRGTKKRWYNAKQEQEILESLAMIRMAWGVKVKEVWSVDGELPATPMGNVDRSAAASFSGDVAVFCVDEDAGCLRRQRHVAC